MFNQSIVKKFPRLCAALLSAVLCAPFAVFVIGPSRAGASTAPYTLSPISQENLGGGGYFQAVSCFSQTSCTAIALGQNGNSIEVLTGNPTTWPSSQFQFATAPTSFGSSVEMNAVSCISATSCVAVGSDGNNKTVILTGDPAYWTGDMSTWSPSVAKATEVTLGSSFASSTSYLSAISCVSSTWCSATGYVRSSSEEPLIFTGDPSYWSGDTSTWSPSVAKAMELTGGSTVVLNATYLNAISCTSSTSCTAVGFANSQGFILTGDPSYWSGDTSTWSSSVANAFDVSVTSLFGSSDFLNAISCTSASMCTAIGNDGNYQGFVVSGNPRFWSGDSSLWSPSNARASEFSLGSTFGPWYELLAISCTSPTFCTATGVDGNGANYEPVVMTGNPAYWSGNPSTWLPSMARAVEATASSTLAGGYLQAVSCVSVTSCVGVGADGNGRGGQPMAFTGNPAYWNGNTSTWPASSAAAFELALPDRSRYEAISCATATSCTAVGYYRGGMDVITGNPTTWTSANEHVILLGSAFGSAAHLTSVSCATATSCTAIGTDGNNQVIVFTGNPTTWTSASPTEATINSSLGGQANLTSVSCATASSCTAICTYINGISMTFTGNPINWTGDTGSWSSSSAQAREITFGSAFGASGELTSVSCATATSCTAIGTDGNGLAVALTGNPATWTDSNAHEIALDSTYGNYPNFASISCVSAVQCTAAGSDGNSEPFILTGNPATWTQSNAREISLGSSYGSNGYLYSVSCSSSTACDAVGLDANSLPFIVTGNPTSWSGDPSTWSSSQGNIAEVANPSSYGSTPTLYGVSCSTSMTCTAVGDSTNYGFSVLISAPNAQVTLPSSLSQLTVGTPSSSTADLTQGFTIPFSANATSGTLSVPANALVAGVTVSVYPVLSSTGVSLPSGESYVASAVVLWGGSATTSASPLTLTLTNSSIQAGDKLYEVVNGTPTLLGTVSQSGTATFTFSQDPLLLITRSTGAYVLPTSAPSAPVNVQASVTGDQAVVSFTPGSTGNLKTFNQVIEFINGINYGATCTVGFGSSCIVNGIAPNTDYAFQVVATNALGSATSTLSSDVKIVVAVPPVVTTTTQPATPPVKTTISCAKAKLTKKVTAVSPVCPVGWKKK